MAIRIPWTKYEVALLIDACVTFGSTQSTRTEAIKELSKTLRKLAIKNNIEIDDIYRNENGITMQFNIMQSLLCNKESGLHNASKLFVEMKDLYYQNNSEYKKILKEAQMLIDDSKKKQDTFVEWLSTQVSPAKLSEFYLSYEKIDAFCLQRGILKKTLLETTDIKCVHKVLQTVEKNKVFRFTYKREINKIISAVRYYYEFLKNKENIELETKTVSSVDSSLFEELVRTKQDEHLLGKYPIAYKRVKESLCRSATVFGEKGVTANSVYENIKHIARIDDIKYILENASWSKKNGSRYTFSQKIIKKENIVMDNTKILKSGVDDKANIAVATRKNDSDDTSRLFPYYQQVKTVLREHYQYGFRLESTIDMKRFRKYSEELDIVLPESDDLLKTEIKNAGIKIEDKVYLIETNTFDFIRDIIDKFVSGGSLIIFYECIYDFDMLGMEEHYITEFEQLKAIMKQCRQNIFEDSTKVYFAKNFISLIGEKTERDAVTVEILRVWGDGQTRHVDDLSKHLPAIPKENVRRYLSGSDAFVWISEGVYFNMQRFVITEDERAEILFFVEEGCNNKGYASISEVPFGNIEEENYELTTVGLYEAVYNAVLLNQYYLNGKILTKEDKTLDVVTLAKQYLIDKDECTFDEIDKKVEKIAGTRYRYMAYEAIYSTMVRVDKNRYVAHRYLKFDVDEIDEILSEMIKNKFLAIKEITSFALFPVCGFPWNHYLLESYCYSYSKRYCLKVIGFNDKNAGIIAENDVTDEYYELLAQAAARAKIELNAETVGQYYFETGYMGKRRFSDLESTVERAKAIREDL